LKRFTSPI